VGHVCGTVENISVFGGKIEATLKNHRSDYGTMGYIDLGYMVGGKLPGHINDGMAVPAAGGDTGYLYADSLFDRIGAEAVDNNGNYVLDSNGKSVYYLTSGGFATASPNADNPTTWKFKSEKMLSGFGIFSLVTSSNKKNGMIIDSITRLETIDFAGVFGVDINTTTAGDMITTDEYPATAQTNIKLNKKSDNTKIAYLQDQIINIYSTDSDKRITGFDHEIKFVNAVQNNAQNLTTVDDYSGADKSAVPSGAKIFSDTLRFTLPGMAQQEGESDEDYDTRSASNYADIVVVVRNSPRNGGQLYFNKAMEGLQRGSTKIIKTLETNSASSASAYVFRVYDYIPEGYVVYTKEAGAACSILYIAVGGQTGGEGQHGNQNQTGTVQSIDFVYKTGGTIIPVTDDDYAFSNLDVIIVYTGNQTATCSVDFLRTIDSNGTSLTVKWKGSTSTVTINDKGSGDSNTGIAVQDTT
jgi:hypothetical protein